MYWDSDEDTKKGVNIDDDGKVSKYIRLTNVGNGGHTTEFIDTATGTYAGHFENCDDKKSFGTLVNDVKDNSSRRNK